MPNGNNNSKITSLAGLLNKLDLPTLLVVLFMGGGNFLATKQDGQLTREEAVRVANEVHAIHATLDDTQKRQNEAIEHLTRLLQGQQDILNEIRHWQQNYRSPEK